MHTPEHTLEESKRLELEASKLTGVAPVLGNEAITTSDITSPISAPQFQTPTPTPVPDVTKIDSTPPAPTPEPMKLTPQEQTISDEEKAVREGNIAIQGQSAFRAEQEAALITPEMRKTQTDLSARLKALQNEALAIPLQLEKEFSGRASIGSIQGFSREAVRQNAIQALGVSALLEASRGNITLAQDQVDRAVAAKYGPLEEAQRVRLENLESLRRDPRLTVEQQNRLEKQKKTEEAEKSKTEAEKKNFEESRKEALNYAGIADALTLKEMEKAKTALEVAQIARNKNLTTPEQLKATAELALTNAKTEKEKADALKAIKEAGTPTKYVPGSNPTVDNWAKLIISGQASITQVPNPRGSTLRSDVVDAITNSGQLLLSDKDREKLSTLDTAFNVYETIKGLSKKINTFDVVGRVTGYLSRYVGGATQYNVDIARYNATRQGFVSNIARTLGEKGTLAEGDVQRAINNLPTINDTQAVAQGKLETLKSILEGAKNSIIQKSTEPLNKTTAGTLGQILLSPDGTQQVKISDLTPAQIEEAKKAGWK